MKPLNQESFAVSAFLKLYIGHIKYIYIF